ncbi:MAG: hypothetical protein WC465_00610 [Patescibacteria group bacterium]
MNFSVEVNNFINTLLTIGSLPPDIAFIYLMTHYIWPIYVVMILWMAYDVWLTSLQNKWFATHKFILLAIDIPKDTEQTPKAIEQLFATLSGAHTPISTRDKYAGMFQLSFSFEIVSIDGYIQFLIRTPSHWRDLVESSIYSQYPDAEITEVEDYTTDLPRKFPDDKYNMWGAEIVLVNKDVYPIKTYIDFEDAVSGEFKDPMASILETMSKIQAGEQVWVQLIVRPTDHLWTNRSKAEADKLAGKKVKAQKGLLERLFGPLFGLFFLSGGDSIFWPTGAESKSEKKANEPISLMLYMTPGERIKIEAVEKKASKIGFQCKIRLVYLSPKEQYNPGRVVSSVFGSLKQFSTMHLNSFKPDAKTKTKIEWIMVKTRTNWRRTNLIRAYKSRSGIIGHGYFILNTEELATLWHFPSKFIRTPLLQKTESKKAEPPASLPIMSGIFDTQTEQASAELRQQLKTVPEFNIPLDNTYFEERFAKDKSQVKPRHTKNEPPTNLPVTK